MDFFKLNTNNNNNNRKRLFLIIKQKLNSQNKKHKLTGFTVGNKLLSLPCKKCVFKSKIALGTEKNSSSQVHRMMNLVFSPPFLTRVGNNKKRGTKNESTT